MTIRELKQIIENLPDHMDVFIAERTTEFAYGMVNSATVKTIPFYESEDDNEPLSHDEVLILDEL